jgi:hypothetical protein
LAGARVARGGAAVRLPTITVAPGLTARARRTVWGNISAHAAFINGPLMLAGLSRYMSGANAPSGQGPVTAQFGVHGGSKSGERGLRCRDPELPPCRKRRRGPVGLSTLQGSGGTDCQTGEVEYFARLRPPWTRTVTTMAPAITATRAVELDSRVEFRFGWHGDP